MSLTFGSGPFGSRPAGRFNADLRVPEPLLYFERSPLRVRALLAGETVVDSHRTMLLLARRVRARSLQAGRLGDE